MKHRAAVNILTSLGVLAALAIGCKLTPSQRVTPQAFTLNPGQYHYWQIPAGSGSHLYGRFHASGAGGNDVEAFVFDEEGFENWRNGHQATYYYMSNRVTVGSFDVRLNAGNNYLVFSNNFSLISNKAVTADIFLE
jgi:phosphodiesterase/alkaline phosphatase D-like protein